MLSHYIFLAIMHLAPGERSPHLSQCFRGSCSGPLQVLCLLMGQGQGTCPESGLPDSSPLTQCQILKIPKFLI